MYRGQNGVVACKATENFWCLDYILPDVACPSGFNRLIEVAGYSHDYFVVVFNEHVVDGQVKSRNTVASFRVRGDNVENLGRCLRTPIPEPEPEPKFIDPIPVYEPAFAAAVA